MSQREAAVKPKSWKFVRAGLIIQAFALLAYLITIAVVVFVVVAKRAVFRNFDEEVLTTLFAIAVAQLIGGASCLFSPMGCQAKTRFSLAFFCNVVVLTILTLTFGEEPISLLFAIFCFNLGIWALIDANQRLGEQFQEESIRKACNYSRTALWMAIAVVFLRIWFLVVAPWLTVNLDKDLLGQIAMGLTMASLLSQLLLIFTEIRMLMQVQSVLSNPKTFLPTSS